MRLDAKAEEECLHQEAKVEAKAEAERIRLEQERMRLEEKAEAERIRLEQQFEWQRAQAAEESARQQAQFEWQRAQAVTEKKTREEQFAWQRDKEVRKRANRERMRRNLNYLGTLLKMLHLNFLLTLLTFQYSLKVLKSYLRVSKFQLSFKQNYYYHT